LQNKCAKYWPDLGENPMMFNDLYVVESTRSEEAESYCLTYLTLHNLETEETRMVLHFHYLQWPDFGVPQTPNVFLEYLLAVRGSGVLDSGVGPTLVHCSAGIGRSGTFCVVDVCLAKLEETRNLNSLNVQELLLDMRKQRLGLIQTPDQLRFSYIAILQGAYNNLGLKNSLYELSQELQAEEEEEKESESEEDSLVSSDEGKTQTFHFLYIYVL
jgi:protein tyrosine phosphatase